MARSHYEVLGVGRDATTAEIRAAHRRMALDQHPDRVTGGTEAERREAAARMAEINAAAAELSDPERRRAYDRRLGPPAGAVPSPEVRSVQPADPTASLVRMGPWIALVLVLGGIFMFTAFAGGPGTEDAPPSPTVEVRDLRGSCIQVTGGFNLVVNCVSTPHRGEIVAQGSLDATCPEGTEPFVIRQEDVLACVDPRTAVP